MEQTTQTGKCRYNAYHLGKVIEVEADTAFKAQIIAALKFKAKKRYEVRVILTRRADGSEVDHHPAGL